MKLDDLLSNLPDSLIQGTHDVIKNISSDLRSRDIIKEINEDQSSFKVLATDGSNALVERRGGAIALFSAISIVYDHSERGNKIESIYELDPSQALFIILPKYAVISRANTLMRALEYLLTCSAIEDSKEIDYIILDGSFSSVLLDPMRIILPIYEDLRSLIPDTELRANLLIDLAKEIADKMKDLRTLDAKDAMLTFLSNYYHIIQDILESFMDQVPEGAKITFQHYAISTLEQSFAGMALSRLIETADKLKKAIVWISKDSESRMLTKKYGIIGLFNDLTLLDFILKPREHLVLNDFMDIPPINERRLRFINKINNKRMEIPIIARDLIESIYAGYGAYEVSYVKFTNFVIQLSYPRRLSYYLNGLNQFLSNLETISKLGYPEPLIIVHYRCKINQKLIENISEGLYKRCKESRNEVVCNAISDLGRKRIGL